MLVFNTSVFKTTGKMGLGFYFGLFVVFLVFLTQLKSWIDSFGFCEAVIVRSLKCT